MTHDPAMPSLRDHAVTSLLDPFCAFREELRAAHAVSAKQVRGLAALAALSPDAMDGPMQAVAHRRNLLVLALMSLDELTANGYPQALPMPDIA